MELILASQRDTYDTQPDDTQIPDRFDNRHKPDLAPDATDDHRNYDGNIRRLNRSFFLTPSQTDDPGFSISKDSALKSGLSTKTSKAIQLTESCLSFHSNYNSSSVILTVSSFQRAITVGKSLIFTHMK